MPNFAYTGRTRTGQTVTGEKTAESMDAASAALKREQIQVTRIRPCKGSQIMCFPRRWTHLFPMPCDQHAAPA